MREPTASATGGPTARETSAIPPEHTGFVEHYGMPLRNPEQPWQEPRVPGAVRHRALRLRSRARLRPRGRRLAYLDSHFPWACSGFRYKEALALWERRPDTLFFSTWEMDDPFPAPVHPLADFPRIAMREGITDVYAVFQLFLEGICGLGAQADGRTPHPMQGPDLWPFLRDAGIRIHGCVYPGGGFVLTEAGYGRVERLASRLDTLITYVPQVLNRVPAAIYVPQALTDTRFYAHSDERWERTDEIVCLFAADGPPRKGIDAAIGAFQGLGEGFRLEVAGPHAHRANELPRDRATFHGWLSAEALRDLHRRAHVFLAPVRAEQPGPSGSFEGVVDGFPTVAASDAMSSGCLLVSANPGREYRVLEPGIHYVECEPEPGAILRALMAVRSDLRAAREIADRGAERVRSRMEIRDGVAAKLEAMGLADD